MTVTTYSNAMQMDVNPAGEVYSILRDNPIPLDISTITPFVISSVVEKSLRLCRLALPRHL